jgi:hypothetical protein
MEHPYVNIAYQMRLVSTNKSLLASPLWRTGFVGFGLSANAVKVHCMKKYFVPG